MDARLMERTRRLVEDVDSTLSLVNARTVQDLLFYLAELEEKVILRSFCPYCGKGLTQKNS